ncbi:hypothetical protein M427DRAFT_57944 [Gonapodya prolifera JEL478]|uniref:N-acetyltransferase domain-containing protein n=1 Tax=Gonapodya prolifera (strain JEL478) TaxID=1344416 RepID=A0A139ACQ2_GONPJ|nr:hypothetical protein M427DRAFT_57944 [Gonapodya prolifera JEL478]|eukprot:KXS14193.1 hypothetical protein M427DRAFT_57944 [Gonapodya prolifera JEL478]
MPLYHHPRPPTALLSSFLPNSLPVLNAALSPSTLIYASFPPRDDGLATSPSDLPWVIIASLGTDQLRPVCSLEASAHQLSDTEVQDGLAILLSCIDIYCRDFAPPIGERPTLRVGAVNRIWYDGFVKLYPCLDGINFVYLAPPLPADLKDSVRDADDALPERMEFGPVREQDIPEVVRTSGVPHSPAYLSSRLGHSSAVFDQQQLVAHCFSHRDGSVGTLHVAPSHRRLGLARFLVRARALQEPGLGALAYVNERNAASRALMRKIGWTEGWQCCWFGVNRACIEAQQPGESVGGL